MNSKQAHLAHRSKKKISPAEFPMKMKRNVKIGHFLLKVKNCFQSLHTPKGTCTIAGISLPRRYKPVQQTCIGRLAPPSACIWSKAAPREGNPTLTDGCPCCWHCLRPTSLTAGPAGGAVPGSLPRPTARTPGPEGAAAAPRPEQGSFRQATSRLAVLSQTAVLLPGCTLHSVEKLGWGWGERS